MRPNNERLPLILALLAGVAMISLTAWQGYRFWLTAGGQEQQYSARPLVAEQAAERTLPGVNLESLALFGSASGEDAPAQENTENLPETNLRLLLRGVLAADGEFPGSALIEDDSGSTEAYLVGEALPGNATLRSVHPNRVIIQRSGALENLYFPDSENRSGLSVRASQRTTSTPPTPAPPTQSSAGAINAGTDTDNERRREEIRQRLEQLRERLRDNN